MALPQKAIEQLAREPVLTPGWSGRLLMFSSALFFIALSVYFGTRFGYMPYLNDQVEELREQIDAFNNQIPPQKQEQLIDFYSQVANLRDLLHEQKIASVALPWLEENTHKDIVFSSFSASLEQGVITVPGRARTIEALVEQLAFFQEHKDLKGVQFSGTAVDGEGFWSASLIINFREGFFRVLAPAETQ